MTTRHPQLLLFVVAGTGAPVAVYQLNPAFVRGAAPTVAQRPYLASTARSADGRLASVWLAPLAAGKWEIVNLASGDVEREFAQAAHGATAFQEPSVNAWYALRGDRVEPLNGEARHAVGARGTAVAAYQRLVQQRYGDKLSGST